MSAIFGVFNKSGKPIEQEDIAAMEQALIHRATDGAGLWYGQSMFMGHHKLIVTREQQNEKLPFENDDFVITADARIDNRDDLFQKLGIHYNDRVGYPDSLLILLAYRKWQEQCTAHLDGEYAFVIWDKKDKKLFCAVDHIGFRPLFYYDTPEVFVFSSEMKGILAVKKTADTFNEDSLIEYFFMQSDQSKTYNEDVFVLCGGNKLVIEDTKLKITKYWHPQQTGSYAFNKDSDWAACLRDLLEKAVEKRLRTDMPVGIGLSGGLDSSSLACLAGKILEKRNKELFAFSSVLPLGYQGVEQDERKYIGIIQQHQKNIQQVYVEGLGTGPFSDLEEAFSIEETFPNLFFYMDKAINKAAEEKNIRVFLSGYGGDFFVSDGGNYAIRQMINQFKWPDVWGIIRDLHRAQGKSYFRVLKQEYISKTWVFNYINSFRHKEKINWQKYTPLIDSFTGRYKLNMEHPKHQGIFMQAFVGEGNVGRIMGRYANRNEAFRMDSAMPLFDKDVLDFMFDVPARQFVAGGYKRSLLRRAMEGVLPPEIQWRKDKLPYSPDYVKRLQQNKQFINAVLSEERDSFVWRYIDKQKILPHFDDVRSSAGMTLSAEISGIRIGQAIIAVIFLQWLQKKHYHFRK